MQVYVLTKEYNDYDQYGEYFVAVFQNLPTHQQLTEYGVSQHRLKHTLNGGGRLQDEHIWYNLRLEECK